MTTITVQDVIDHNSCEKFLPEGLVGIHWTTNDWTECLDHMEFPGWADGETPVDMTGTMLTGTIDCDSCNEAN